MPLGYQTALLNTALTVFKFNPALQLPYLGFLDMILSNMDGTVKTQPLNDRFALGHQRAMSVAYSKRISPNATSNVPTGCDTGLTPTYSEFTIPNLNYRGLDIWMPDSLIRQYKTDASVLLNLPKKDFGRGTQGEAHPTYIMTEVWERILEACGAVIRAINQDLVADMATQFGVNIASGNANAKAVSFSLGTTAMNDAMVQLLTDIRKNQIMSNVQIVGNGPFANYDLIKDIMSTGASAQGINQAALAARMPKVFYDNDTETIWGANQIGVFEKGSVHFLTRNMNEGSFARSIANSELFTIAVPVANYINAPQYLDRLVFDIQIKEFDCAGEQMTINGEVTTTDGPGVLIKIGKYFKLFSKPSMYEVDDSLYGTNGTLRYAVTATA